mmetsp:Transcript_31366/g.76517  ORF Transcript_31366/g.76517 Transcript_31366/m.76517 type:complete len:87 (-) Transcript_31366:1096-1356(-)
MSRHGNIVPKLPKRGKGGLQKGEPYEQIGLVLERMATEAARRSRRKGPDRKDRRLREGLQKPYQQIHPVRNESKEKLKEFLSPSVS